MRKLLITGAVAGATLLLGATPAGAQQIVDASGERGGGGLAFVLMAIMVLGMGAAMFALDRIRRRPSDDGPEPTP